ncbi:MAG: DUF1893 domain-containing protein [Salinivirgaceae bacterium]|jgi:hypothetical protein
MIELHRAVELLKSGNHTLVLIKGTEQWISDERGIKPLFELVTMNTELAEGATIADKVIGKAGALLAVFGKITSIHAQLTTHAAIKVCLKNNISITYNKVVDAIQNRDKTGNCPMELLAHDVFVPAEMVEKVAVFLKSLP